MEITDDHVSTEALPKVQPEGIKQQEAMKQRSDKITYLNATTSPLLLLPAEIRNIIFEYAMYHGTISLEQVFDSDRCIAKPEHRHAISLLFVCRRINSEVAILPYKLNIFSSTMYCYPDFIDFLKQRTPAQIDLMMEVRCKLSHDRRVHVASAPKWMASLKKIAEDLEMR